MIIPVDTPDSAIEEPEYTNVVYSGQKMIEPEPIIIDPAMFPEPVSRSTWVKKMYRPRFFFDGGIVLTAVPGNYYDPYNNPTFTAKKLIRNFRDLPKFRAIDLEAACQVMTDYIDNERLTNDEVSNKKLNLLDATQRLARELSSPSVDKLNVDQESIICNGRVFTIAAP